VEQRNDRLETLDPWPFLNEAAVLDLHNLQKEKKVPGNPYQSSTIYTNYKAIIPYSSPTDFDYNSDSDTAPVSAIGYRDVYTHQHPTRSPSPETLVIQVVVIATQK
jgi:hypothetical protein